MSIINAIKNYLKTFSGLPENAPIWVNFLGPSPSNTEYAVVPLAGAKVVESYIDGSSLREFPFAFQSMESTADDLERLETAGFYEAFADWLEQQTNNGVFPSLGTGKKAVSIKAVGWAYLYEQGNSDTGIYQIQCKLTYEQIGA
jgi:hypothetical protein